MRRIGVLMGVGDAEGQLRALILRRALQELGWIEGNNITIEVRLAGGASTKDFTQDVTKAASSIGVQLEIAQAGDSREIELAFAELVGRIDALIVAPDTLFAHRRVQIVTLATRHGIPAIYAVREYVEHGGLMSYGPSVPEMYRQLAIYTSRILKGDKPADCPVMQASKFELVINLPTARALGLEVPPSLLARADEVIE